MPSTTPIAIWAVPEPRIGGRLRLNAYCGLNLAAHAHGRAGVPPRHVQISPKRSTVGKVFRQSFAGIGWSGSAGTLVQRPSVA
jgi:hypothetical protein